MERFAACWEGLEDPRHGNAELHNFHELLMIALCTVLCGGQGGVDMEVFAKEKEPFLRGLLKLKKGLPSHDTFSRLFRALDPEQFQAAFQRFMAAFSQHCQGVVAIDGKVLRRSFDRASHKSALHMVSAWGLRTAHGAGADRHRRKVKRDHRRAGAAEDAIAEGHHRDRRRAELPARDCGADCRTGRRLLSGAEGQPRHFA